MPFFDYNSMQIEQNQEFVQSLLTKANAAKKTLELTIANTV